METNKKQNETPQTPEEHEVPESEQDHDAEPREVLPELEDMDMSKALAEFEGGGDGQRPRQQQGGGQKGGDRGGDRRPQQDRRRPDSNSRWRGPERRRVGREHSGEAPRPAGFKREILANTSFEETRVAVVENDRLVELLWERRGTQNIVGNIYKGVVENVLPGISSAFVNIGFEKNAYLYISDVLGNTRAPIDQTLKKGQEIMVQVAKEAIGTKGMKVTMEATLPGRYLVFTPFSQSVGISKHIVDPVERRRISGIIDKMGEELKGRGVVVRTEAEGAGEDELKREIQYLVKAWDAVEAKYKSQPAPALLHKDLDLTMQVARDLLSDDVYVYLLDNKDVHQDVVEFIRNISPELAERVRLYDAKTPIFTAFNIEPEIEKLRQIKVSLPSGGTIVIQEAESLCAIDVNTGRFTGSKSQEETVTMNNIEAAHEIAQQLRLRNIGGIVVIDFIDMKKASNRQRVMEALAHAVKRDRAKIRILPITRLGLIEMTRERRSESTVSLMTDECPECFGSGRVLSAESIRIRIQREIYELTQGREGGNIRLVLHPQLAESFQDKQATIEKNVHRSIKITSDAHLQWEDYRIILE
ncbi:MAG TPA: Rne/Rng family ribonuclease [Elusimicrobiota bacterium]|nr:Rne/Rng family ribonuclease [Elusimicrobiota bacterium]